MKRFASINEKVHPIPQRTMSSHPVTMPVRTMSSGSIASDNEAVPTTDPVNVSILEHLSRNDTKRSIDFGTFGRKIAGLETPCWIPRGVHRRNREGTESACEGIWASPKGWNILCLKVLPNAERWIDYFQPFTWGSSLRPKCRRYCCVDGEHAIEHAGMEHRAGGKSSADDIGLDQHAYRNWAESEGIGTSYPFTTPPRNQEQGQGVECRSCEEW